MGVYKQISNQDRIQYNVKVKNTFSPKLTAIKLLFLPITAAWRVVAYVYYKTFGSN